MYKPSDSWDSSAAAPEPEVMLDGLRVTLPKERRSLAGIRSFLETLALEQQRVLCSLNIDGKAIDLAQPPPSCGPCVQIEAQTMELEDMPLQLIRTAMKQTIQARGQVGSAVARVLINDSRQASELWWNAARDLKVPLLTLSLMPDSSRGAANTQTSLMQLRKWQLQQLAAIIKDVDAACEAGDSAAISNALEYRVLPWLDGLEASLDLWQVTLLAGKMAACPAR